jgi:putative PEP-CTERM system histidine kinase
VQDLILFWSYAAAACAFASVVLWRIRVRAERSEKLLVAACAATAIWAMVAAVCGRTDPMTMLFGTLRNLVWVMLLYEMSGGMRGHALTGVRLVFAAVALSLGLHLVLNTLAIVLPMSAAQFEDVLSTGSLLRITMSAGALILVHNVYGQAAPESRLRIRGPMLGLTLMWGYELNLATLAYLQGSAAAGVADLFRLRGIFLALTAPLFAWTGGVTYSMKVKLSRAATFQSLSLVAIGSYLALMAVLAGALRHTQWNWGSVGTAALLLLLAAGAVMVPLSERARGWMKVKLAKHLFEHRYDYRLEWLQFTETLGRSEPDAPPVGERVIKAFADIVDAPGGILLVEESGVIVTAASWNWAGPHPATLADASEFWAALESGRRVIEFEGLRKGWASPVDRAVPVPRQLIDDDRAWAGIPLIHHDRLAGVVLLAPPDYNRALDWEDFDLLRAAGRHAASALAEAHVQQALANAQRFEEFNRRFAFILHDVKNLVSQLSLLARNAERHADNPEFRADMVETLKSSVGKMNDLLARLSPRSGSRVQRLEPQPLRPVLAAAITAKRGDHEVKLLGDTGLWAVVDGTALEQAVGHLLQNAVEACSPTLPVGVRVARQGDSVSIAVSDKGTGMDSDFVRDRLFQPFSSSKPGRFGIGANEARSLVAAIGGRLNVDSRPGRGTTFTILVPLADAALERERKRA